MQLYILDTLAFYGICTGKLLVVTVYVMISTARDNRGTKMGELEILCLSAHLGRLHLHSHSPTFAFS